MGSKLFGGNGQRVLSPEAFAVDIEGNAAAKRPSLALLVSLGARLPLHLVAASFQTDLKGQVHPVWDSCLLGCWDSGCILPGWTACGVPCAPGVQNLDLARVLPAGWASLPHLQEGAKGGLYGRASCRDQYCRYRLGSCSPGRP